MLYTAELGNDRVCVSTWQGTHLTIFLVFCGRWYFPKWLPRCLPALSMLVCIIILPLSWEVVKSVPSPFESRLASLTCLTKRIRQKRCSGASKTRSLEALKFCLHPWEWSFLEHFFWEPTWHIMISSYHMERSHVGLRLACSTELPDESLHKISQCEDPSEMPRLQVIAAPDTPLKNCPAEPRKTRELLEIIINSFKPNFGVCYTVKR